MELRYEIAEEQLRVFVAALQCLAHVGKEISIECEGTSGVTCRALNDAHSASGQIAFDRSFFVNAQFVPGDRATAAALARVVPFVKCKVFAKSCCNVFRTLKHVRSVQLVFRLDEQAALTEQQRQQDDDNTQTSTQDDELEIDCIELVWRLRCDFDVTKTHCMKVHTCQVMRAVFDRASCANRFVARQHHLASLLGHIHHSTEVCVTCSATHVKFESYAASGTESKAQLHTETAVESVEFNEYAFAPSSSSFSQSGDASVQLIFTLKEVRALLAFCKTSDILEVACFFNSGGSPVLFAAEATSMAKVAVEITLSTITTFLPALSQTTSETELPHFHLANNDDNDGIGAGRESDASQPLTARYLTHSSNSSSSSKRPRVDA